MDKDDRQLLLTTAWLFAMHGQSARARTLCEALVEGDPKDGVAALALADLMLDAGEAKEALSVIRAADCPGGLERAAALLETKALALAGKRAEADRRWSRYVAAARGETRKWVKEA